MMNAVNSAIAINHQCNQQQQQPSMYIYYNKIRTRYWAQGFPRMREFITCLYICDHRK